MAKCMWVGTAITTPSKCSFSIISWPCNAMWQNMVWWMHWMQHGRTFASVYRGTPSDFATSVSSMRRWQIQASSWQTWRSTIHRLVDILMNSAFHRNKWSKFGTCGCPLQIVFHVVDQHTSVFFISICSINFLSKERSQEFSSARFKNDHIMIILMGFIGIYWDLLGFIGIYSGLHHVEQFCQITMSTSHQWASANHCQTASRNRHHGRWRQKNPWLKNVFHMYFICIPYSEVATSINHVIYHNLWKL